MHDYVIAIPSYKRSQTLKIRTLSTLEKYKIEENSTITLFSIKNFLIIFDL